MLSSYGFHTKGNVSEIDVDIGRIKESKKLYSSLHTSFDS